MPTFADARSLAETLLADHLPDRWLHVQSVAREALRISALSGVDREPLIQAAVLHDIGYSPVVARVRFHPLDGARFLTARGYDARVVALVAHHSGAAIEAGMRGVEGLDPLPDEASPTRDALWYCDAVTGPQGQRLTPDERWTEIRRRYGPDDLVTAFLDRAEPELRAAVDRTTARMDAAGLERDQASVES
ncbi:putative nucleotidyltransferase with HDIG domain [Actinomycetospora succinea]|uniref:Putative nucleotidyltransferase with HDIG domain n=1 Tax=Actinomycetospora succinea TaxID=663603 RepID=A0A4V3D7C3_9PSEU|nr:HD domain-containing protein [Actinomycetospora succinea]TDQ47257.1 putative nucleotidyltransferase with HDIG domain [Actinomycetospora succinea]